MDTHSTSVIPYSNLAHTRLSTFFALDCSFSMTQVAPSVVKGYEQCRQQWIQKIPDALFIPAAFNHTCSFLTNGPVTAAGLPVITETQYRQMLGHGSPLIDIAQVGLQLALDRKVHAVYVMTDGWHHRGRGNYSVLRTQFLPKARRLGCHIRFLIYFNPRYENQLLEFIRLAGLQKEEYIVFKHQAAEERVEQTMIGLRDSVLKIHGQ